MGHTLEQVVLCDCVAATRIWHEDSRDAISLYTHVLEMGPKVQHAVFHANLYEPATEFQAFKY